MTRREQFFDLMHRIGERLEREHADTARQGVSDQPARVLAPSSTARTTPRAVPTTAKPGKSR